GSASARVRIAVLTGYLPSSVRRENVGATAAACSWLGAAGRGDRPDQLRSVSSSGHLYPGRPMHHLSSTPGEYNNGVGLHLPRIIGIPFGGSRLCKWRRPSVACRPFTSLSFQ